MQGHSMPPPDRNRSPEIVIEISPDQTTTYILT
jgi:hypothetical protein